MNRKIFRLVFLLILGLHLLGIAANIYLLQAVTKPLIVISLLAYFFRATTNSHQHKRSWVMGALFFSFVGDVFLLLPGNANLYFLLGLCSFLLAHIFYIGFFHKLRQQYVIKPRSWALLAVAVYYALLLTLLTPFLGEMKNPVRIYGAVISFMLMLAMHMLYIPQKGAGRLLFFGALLFVISDSVLAINKFYSPLPFASLIIMATYGAAQFLLVEGSVRILQEEKGN